MVTQEQLAAAIMKLRPAPRRVFVMAHVQGKSHQEIAGAIGITQRRVEKLTTKALRTCRDRLLSDGIMDGVLGRAPWRLYLQAP